MKAKQMRFLADMGISPRCVEWLRTQSHDAVHLFEQGLHRLPDSEVLRKAITEKRILLTMDLDFARLVSVSGADALPTVIIFRLSDQRPQKVQARLEIMFPIIEECLEQGSSIISVSDSKIRIRSLPIR
jgi:predicted nuclease of predicted toxin-antitoxin system